MAQDIKCTVWHEFDHVVVLETSFGTRFTVPKSALQKVAGNLQLDPMQAVDDERIHPRRETPIVVRVASSTLDYVEAVAHQKRQNAAA